MFDFLDATIQFKNNGDITNGYKEVFTKEGTSKITPYSVQIRLNNGACMQAVSIDEEHIRITGNPSKFIQGQNVFGPDNLNALTSKVARLIAKELGLNPTRENKKSWRNGDFNVHRIDITNNFTFPSQDSVCEWLDKVFFLAQSGKQSIEGHRQSSSHHVETIYVGKNSKFISLKFYNKYREIKVKLDKAKKEGQIDPMLLQLTEHAETLLRCEIRLHKRYLKKYDLTRGSSLTPEVIYEHFFKKLDRISFGTSEILPVTALKNLKKNERLAYECWLRGSDVQELVSKSTFERLRNRVMELDCRVDIRHPFVNQFRGRPLKYYLNPANVAEVPNFLFNTKWYYDR